MAEFLRLILTRPWSAAAGFAASLLSTVSSVSLMSTAAWFIAAMAQAGAAGVLINILIPSALIRLLAVSRTGLRYLDRLALHDAAFRIIASLRLMLFDKILSLPFEQEASFKDSYLEHALRKDAAVLENAYLKVLVPMAAAFCAGALFGAAAACCAGVVPSLALLMLMALSSALVPFALCLASRRIAAAARPLRQELFNTSHDLSCGLLDILSLNEAGAFKMRIDGLSLRIASASASSEMLEGIALAISKAGAMGAMLLSLAICSDMALCGAMQGPVYVMLATASMAVYEAMFPLAAAFFGMGEVRAASRSISALGQAAPASGNGGAQIGAIGKIAFAGACASCASGEILHCIDLEISSAENTLVRGPVGSGKSTLFMLMQGFAAPSSGKVTADGVPLSEADPSCLRRAMPMALQDPQLFSGSVRDVFTMVRPGASDDEIRQVLSIVELDGFLASLPQGLSQWLGPAGRALSGGEARRLCIARALFASMGSRSSFLILDEPCEG
ncbi:MAG: ATP-binding cassette domain-containing protein, partial [Succinivibrio sp.]